MGIERDCVINGERFALVVETRHEPGVTAWTAVHRQDFDRRIGGARTVVAGHRSEVGYLSAAMTQKCAAAWLPADGEKTLVVTGAPLPDESTRIRLLREHLAAVVEADPGVIFGPDMNNGEPVMEPSWVKWVASTPSSVFTMPKSSNLATSYMPPRLAAKMLPGLMSR